MLRPGDIFAGRFRIVRKLGRGNFGAVFEVEHKVIPEKFALKVMEPLHVDGEKSLKNFLEEARKAATIDSPYVVKMHDVGQDEESGLPWIQMELLQGETLEDHVGQHGAMPQSEFDRLFRDLGRAMIAAHEKGIFHLDLKPANLFIETPKIEGYLPHLKVLDFGIARIRKPGATSATHTTARGTIEWMAPEQANLNRVSAACDVWAMGLIAFYMLTGKEYWKCQHDLSTRGQQMALFNEFRQSERVPASARAEEVKVLERLPEGFDAWFDRCLRQNPHERWKDANEAIRAMWPDFATSLPPTRASLPTTPSIPRTEPVVVGDVGGSPRPPAPSPVPGEGEPERESRSMQPLSAPGTGEGGVEGKRSRRSVLVASASVVTLVALGVGLPRACHPVTVVRDAGPPPPDRLNVPPLPAPRFACPSGSVAIRGGSFDMGDDAGDMGHLRHRVTVSPYCLDTTEVTVAAFRTFWNANHPAPTGPVAYPRAALPWTDRVTAPLARNATDNARFTWSDAPGDREDHPINGVDWHTMQAFCVWKGGRLPTEAEWEFAARGTDRRAFPWGDEAPTGLQLNACGDECRDTFHGAWRAMSGFGRDPFSATAPVGRFTKTRPEGVFFDDDPDAGLFDLSGNVWEWTADAESPHRDAGATTDATDPLQTEGELRVSRGGAWDDSVAAWVRATSRSAAAPNHRFDNRGARCAYAPRSPER